MTADRAALVEKVAIALTNADGAPIPDNFYSGSHPIVSDWAAFLATAALDIIRNEVLEEAAREFDQFGYDPFTASSVATAIRALKGKA